MKNTYEFSLEENHSEIEDHEKNNDEIIKIAVFDKAGNDISNDITYVLSDFGYDAEIGLGTELIRLAHNFEVGKEVHIKPSNATDGAIQSMGVYLAPGSPEVIIRCEEFAPIETYIDEWAKTHKE